MSRMRYLSAEELSDFANKLIKFRDTHNLEELFSSSIDHVAVKMRNSEDYEEYKKEILPDCKALTEAKMNGRRIATAELAENISVVSSNGESIGSFSRLEIMEPRPHKVGKDIVGIDHCEIIIHSFTEAAEMLRNKNISINEGDGENEYVHTVVVRLNDKGQEVKFSDEPLGEVIKKELASGISVVIK